MNVKTYISSIWGYKWARNLMDLLAGFVFPLKCIGLYRLLSYKTNPEKKIPKGLILFFYSLS